MAKGDIQKQVIVKKLQEVFGDNFKGEYNKAYYINVNAGGETVQVKVALTCPKTPIEFDETINATPTGDFDWSESSTIAPAAGAKTEPTEITDEEISIIKTMLENLNL